MKFQHTTPMPSGVSMMLSAVRTMEATESIGLPQMATVGGNSGDTLSVIPGDFADTLSVTLIQLLVTWGEVIALGKFIVQTKDSDSLTFFQDKESGSILLPLWDLERYLGNQGLSIQNNSTGGEYSVILNYRVKEI